MMLTVSAACVTVSVLEPEACRKPGEAAMVAVMVCVPALTVPVGEPP